MELTLGFGTTEMPVRIPDRNLLAVLTPNPVSPGLAGEAEVRRALDGQKASANPDQAVVEQLEQVLAGMDEMKKELEA